MSGIDRKTEKPASRQLVLLLSWLALGLASPGSGQQVTIAPGGLVRWPGSAIDRCGLADRAWRPLGAECWYPVDLLQPEGALELTRWLTDGRREVVEVLVGAYPYEIQHITIEDSSKVDLSAEDLRRVEQENRSIAGLWNLETERRFELPLAAPLDRLPAGGRFGARRFFNNLPRSPHTGVDFSAASGSRVLAVGAGTVALTGDFFFPGKSVFIDHGDGLISMYFHLSGVAVEAGDTVERSEIIGLVGQSGRATGPHLHLGLRWHGDRIDPTLLLQPIAAVPVLP